MIKNLTCIECPKGCRLSIEVDSSGHVVKVTGNQCEKGDRYGRSEIENPVRIFTSSIVADGLSLKMVPVRTNQPIPKAKISEGMVRVKKIRIKTPIKINDIIVRDFLVEGVHLIATRDVS